jgi:rhodanese-related sulfurtransferase
MSSQQSRSSLLLALLLLLLLLLLVGNHRVQAATTLEPSELYAGIQQGLFNILVDVRSSEEWDAGHLANATLAMNMASSGVELPPELLDCKTCPIVVYCRSGSRAGVAINRMVSEYGFDTNNLFNGQGVSQWTEAGYPLDVSPESTDPQCSQRDEFCMSMVTETEETTSPTSSPTVTPPTTASATPPPVLTVSPDELYQGMMDDQFDMVLDVRSVAEFEEGHIPNVTFIEGLATSGVEPTLLLQNNATCRFSACKIAVTCRTGGRAGAAIERLQSEYGFVYTQFYNGGGVSQWQEAGYALDMSLDSVVPKCVSDPVNGTFGMIQRNDDGSCNTCCNNKLQDDSMASMNATGDVAVDNMGDGDFVDTATGGTTLTSATGENLDAGAASVSRLLITFISAVALLVVNTF